MPFSSEQFPLPPPVPPGAPLPYRRFQQPEAPASGPAGDEDAAAPDERREASDAARSDDPRSALRTPHSALPSAPPSDEPYLDWGPDLPATYGRDHLALMVKDPFTLFVYWETTGDRAARYAEQHGADFRQRGHWELHLKDLTRKRITVHRLPYHQQDGWYAAAPEHRYGASLGFRLTTGEWLPFAEAEPMATPSNRIAPVSAETFRARTPQIRHLRRLVGESFLLDDFPADLPPPADLPVELWEDWQQAPPPAVPAWRPERSSEFQVPSSELPVGEGEPPGEPAAGASPFQRVAPQAAAELGPQPSALSPQHNAPSEPPPDAGPGRWVFETVEGQPGFVWVEEGETAAPPAGERTRWVVFGPEGEERYDAWVEALPGWFGGGEWEEIPGALWALVEDEHGSAAWIQSGVGRRRRPFSGVVSGLRRRPASAALSGERRRPWSPARWALPALSGRRARVWPPRASRGS